MDTSTMDSSTSFGAFVDYPCVNLRGGVPGTTRLKNCPDLFVEATKAVLHKDCDVNDIFSYGFEGGDDQFRQHLATFLSEEYGDQVEKDCVMMTAGATHGLHVAMTLLISASSPIYVIDPSYFLGQSLIQDDLPHSVVVAAPSDAEGPLIDELEKLIKTHQPTTPEVVAAGQQNGGDQKGEIISKNTNRPYDGAVYLIPTFNNPRATSYTPDRCRKLVALARKYNLLLLADDVYNLVYFTDKADQPKRLLTYDLPSDPDYDGKGHVLSNGSFSKILAPGVRLGWIEGPKQIVHMMSKSMIAVSGGAFNQYVGKLVTELLRSGKLKEHLGCLRHDYKSAMKSLCDVLEKDLPKDCSFDRPKGGFFIWIRLHPDVSGTDLLEYCEKNYQVTFLPGVRTSPSKGYTNYVRLATSFVSEDILVDAGKKISKGYNEFVALKGIK